MDDPSEQQQRLQQAIDVLCEDAARVEIWACALSGFAQPVPDYSRMPSYRLDGAAQERPNRPR
jgi:hypothetical protein